MYKNTPLFEKLFEIQKKLHREEVVSYLPVFFKVMRCNHFEFFKIKEHRAHREEENR